MIPYFINKENGIQITVIIKDNKQYIYIRLYKALDLIMYINVEEM